VDEDAGLLEEKYGIPYRYVEAIMSPWAVKRLEEYNGDISQFKVVKLYPSRYTQVAIAKTEPGDENNQDISSLVGKIDIRRLDEYAQNDPDAYSFSGGLCLANRGILEFVEMFKAPIKVLHPLLTATQEGNYNGTEGMSSIPFDGIILAHSNESEWDAFKNNKKNEAFIDRVFIVKVPYCLRVSEETSIYEKLLRNSSLCNSPCAPGTLKMISQFAVLTRLKDPENSSIYSKMRIYDGENLKDTDPKAKTYQEYRDFAGVDEGMHGLSTRFSFKILSRVFNFDHTEIAANPVHLCSNNKSNASNFHRKRANDISRLSKNISSHAMLNSSAKKFKRLTLNRILNTVKTFLIAISRMLIIGFKIRNIATPIPARF